MTPPWPRLGQGTATPISSAGHGVARAGHRAAGAAVRPAELAAALRGASMAAVVGKHTDLNTPSTITRSLPLVAPRATVIVGVPSTLIGEIWPLVDRMLMEACKRGRGKETPDDILLALTARDLQLWLLWDGTLRGLVVTEIIRHPRKICCRIRFCTGRGRENWQRHIATIERWAKAQGCAAMELIARPGWSRLLKNQDYAVTHLFCEKEL